MLQHQIVQSPARLGLTNPNSPSLNQQNNQQVVLPPTTSSTTTPPPTTTTTTITTTSSKPPQNSTSQASITPSTTNVLLSLLPPLGRAQSLLAQMASLAARLFEVSPNRSIWLASFRGTLPTFLSSSGASAGSSTKEILTLFTSLQTQLFEAVAQLQEILDLQDATAKLSRDVRSKDAAILSFANRLKDSERLLDILLDDYSHLQKRPKPANDDDEANGDDDEDDEDDHAESVSSATTTVASRLNLSDILSYSHRISYTTFAPPEFGAGQAPLRGALPPAPQEEQMRASQLYNFANLDVGLPPKDADSDTPMIEAPPPPPPPPRSLPADPDFGLLPPNITVPVGWKPGMPVELPSGMPLPPPGWKPGDPVPLPPLPSLPLRPTEPIQVRHVQLDILDQDDDSSDYSSDDASSEEDD